MDYYIYMYITIYILQIVKWVLTLEKVYVEIYQNPEKASRGKKNTTWYTNDNAMQHRHKTLSPGFEK